MPPPLLFDLDQISPSAVAYDRAAIYARMPHRFEFELLDGIYFIDRRKKLAAAYHDCRVDEWWTRGHVPGRPVFPGILQLEAAAHLIAFVSRYVDGFASFIAFSGVDDCRFREAVIPPARFIILTKLIEDRPRRIKADAQGVVDRRVVFEARIIGMAMPDRD